MSEATFYRFILCVATATAFTLSIVLLVWAPDTRPVAVYLAVYFGIWNVGTVAALIFGRDAR